MTKDETKDLIYKAAETLTNGFEFDAKMIEEILFEQFDEVISSKTIGQYLGKMNFSQRELDPNSSDAWRWEQQYGTKPRTVYSRHLGSNSRNYERGIGVRKTRPQLSVLQERELDIEECTKCPEFDECQGNIRPCPRFVLQSKAPKDRVLRLEDFE